MGIREIIRRMLGWVNRNRAKFRAKLRGVILTGVTVMATYILLASVGMIDLPEWDASWRPVQACMFCVGGAWLVIFMIANGVFDIDDDEEEDDS